MTYNVFGGTLNLAQSINITSFPLADIVWAVTDDKMELWNWFCVVLYTAVVHSRLYDPLHRFLV